MKSLYYKLIFTVLFMNTSFAMSQVPDSIYKKNIQTVRLYPQGDQLTMPIISLNSGKQLELHFDDLDADVKYYYYTLQLCNADWQPEKMSSMEYLKGFSQGRINNYRYSSIALTRYTHYQAFLPDKSMMPTKSGNYLLKVFLDGDEKKLVFTKRFMIVENKSAVVGRVTQPLTPEKYRTHQKVQFTVDIKGLGDLNAAQHLKVVILQNYRWDNAMKNIKPTFVRGTSLEYNSESIGIFPGGKEWRWLDIRDFHLQSDRVASADYNKNSTDIFLRPDVPLDKQPYVYYRDLDGLSSIEAIRGVNPFFEGDYATVNFTYVTPDRMPLNGKDIYLFGQLTNYSLSDSIKMNFNESKGAYETHLFLKQGYYDYNYLSVDQGNLGQISFMDGNSFEAENNYTILVYYRSFTGRTDELIGVASFNSRTDRPGYGY